ncbi:GPW/gp25 family protein [Solidesulfovibrio sp.]
MAYDVSAAERPPIVIGATGLDEIFQNVRIILATMAFSVPLDRAFAGDGDILDTPSPFAAQRRMASIVETVERYEPRVQVLGIAFTELAATDTMDGRLAPVLQITLRQGVVL